MSRLIVILVLISVVAGCGEKERKKQATAQGPLAKEEGDLGATTGQVAFPVLDFENLEPLLHRKDGKTYIINFWATWCKPCLEEMPHFERINAEFGDQGVEVVLVSLDMPNMWKSRLEPYVEKENIRSKVVILDDPKQNEWIPKVSEQWGGGIPATLIYNVEKRSFHERGFTYGELREEVEKFVTKKS